MGETRSSCGAAAAMEEPWTGEPEGAKQRAERAGMKAFGLEYGTTVCTGRVRRKKRLNLLLQHALLDSGKELLGFLERQTEMFKAGGILLQGDEVGHRFFTAIIAAHDQLQFDAHEGILRFRWWGMMPVILPEFVDYPQHLHALRPACLAVTRVTLDGCPSRVPPCEAACHAHTGADRVWTHHGPVTLSGAIKRHFSLSHRKVLHGDFVCVDHIRQRQGSIDRKALFHRVTAENGSFGLMMPCVVSYVMSWCRTRWG